MEDTLNGASFNEDRTHRYSLWRRWHTLVNPILFVLPHPGTADEENDDNDVAMCTQIAKHFKAGGVYICCAWPGVNMSEEDLLKSGSAKNDSVIMQTAIKCSNAVFLWNGDHRPRLYGRDLELYAIISYVGTYVQVLKNINSKQIELIKFLPEG